MSHVNFKIRKNISVIFLAKCFTRRGTGTTGAGSAWCLHIWCLYQPEENCRILRWRAVTSRRQAPRDVRDVNISQKLGFYIFTADGWLSSDVPLSCVWNKIFCIHNRPVIIIFLYNYKISWRLTGCFLCFIENTAIFFRSNLIFLDESFVINT